MTGHGPRQAMARVLALEVALLEAEVDLMARLIAAGILPKGARRQPTGPELRAGVRFAELDRIVNDAAALIARKADRVRNHVLDGLAERLGTVAHAADPWATVEELANLTDPTHADALPGLRKAIDDATAGIRADLIATAQAGAAEALDEARRQGIPDSLIGDVTIGPEVEAAATAHAAKVAQAPATRLLDVAAEAGARAATAQGATGYDVLTAALDGAEQTSRAGQEDAARQAANVTHGLGRAAAQAALPAPSEVYASELLDSNTCGPCATVDGRTYTDLAAGLVDYPGAGGYIGCDGGSRCRGTLVLVHGSEAPPTLNNPGTGGPAPGGPVDRTPQGPSGAPRPPHIAPDGSLIPQPPDKGTPPPSGLAADVLGADGRTVIPLDHLEPPVATVDVAQRPDLADPAREFADWEDHHLEALLVDESEPLERRMLAADELDGRAAGTRAQVWREEELDAATLAQYEAEQEAWEKAGGYAAQAVADTLAGPGRRIDKVRAMWADQLEMDYLAAEDATRGTLLRADRAAEYRAKYGASTAALFEGPAKNAYYYASRELRDHWEAIGGRKTFAEFAVDAGITDAKTTARAAAAVRAREDAIRLAEESADRRKARKAAADRRRRPLTPGERLEREQRRRDRIRAQERRLAAEAQRETIPEVIAAPVEAAPVLPPVVEAVPAAVEAPAGVAQVAGRVTTPADVIDALLPKRGGWTTTTRAKTVAQLKTTPEGRQLLKTVDSFQSGGATAIPRLRTDVEKYLAGDTSLDPGRVDAIENLLAAIGNTDAGDRALWRGMSIPGTAEDVLARYAAGSPLDLSISSFSSDKKLAQGFSEKGAGQRVKTKNNTPVLVEWVGPNKRALPIENLGKSRVFAEEREWVAAGRYVVEGARKVKRNGVDTVVVTIRQLEVW